MTPPREATSRVTEWILAQGWEIRCVVPKRKGQHGFWCRPNKKIIETNPQVSEHVYLYSLLHECGHLVFSDPQHITLHSIWNTRLVTRRRSLENFSSKSKSACLASLDEEFDAWAQAEVLASALGISLDYKRFAKHRAECLRSHIEDHVVRLRK